MRIVRGDIYSKIMVWPLSNTVQGNTADHYLQQVDLEYKGHRLKNMQANSVFRMRGKRRCIEIQGMHIETSCIGMRQERTSSY